MGIWYQFSGSLWRACFVHQVFPPSLLILGYALPTSRPVVKSHPLDFSFDTVYYNRAQPTKNQRLEALVSNQKPDEPPALRFIERPQATSTDADFANLALFNDHRLLNVQLKLTFGVPHRVTDLVTKLRGFSANLTLCHWIIAS
jgi:hypothetical protein